MTTKEKRLRKALSPELAEFYRVLTGFVKAGNCLFDDGITVEQILGVELETDTKGILKGFVFTG